MEWLPVEMPAPVTVRPQGGLLRDRPASIIFQEPTLIIGRCLNMSSDHLENSIRPAADRFLVLLKTRGPQTAADLGKATGVTAEAARQQLVRLAVDGLVVATALTLLFLPALYAIWFRVKRPTVHALPVQLAATA